MRGKTLAAFAATLTLLTQTASAAVWVFGDSNVDTGWFTTAPFSGHMSFDTYLSQATRYGIGKQTNNPGPMSVEVLASLLGVTAYPANKPGGTNYATSGAKNLEANTPNNGGFPNAVPTITQLGNFIKAHKPASTDLFIIDSGANDITYALTLTLTEQQSYIRQQAAELAKGIKALQSRGAAHIIVTNQPESFGDQAHKSARQLYDTTLRDSLNSFGVTYAWGDANSVRQDIVNNPPRFNILYTDTQEAHIACPGGPQAGFASGWAILCSANSPVITPTSFAQNTLFADDGHWASGAQKALGSYYYCLVRATWPTLVPPFGPRPPITCDAFSQLSPPVVLAK